MVKHLYLGQIGCGNWGTKLLSIFNSMQNASVVSCYDSNQIVLRKLSKQYPSMLLARNYQTIFDDPKINAVIIATPPNTHFALVRNALKHGKHVFVEKPFTLNTHDAKLLLGLSKKNNKIVMIDHTFIYSPDILKLKNILQRGILGKLLHIEMAWLNLGLFSRKIDVIWDLAPHPISILFFLLDKYPFKLYSDATGHLDKKILDTAHINIWWKDYLTAHIFLSWLYPQKIRQIILIGSKAMATYTENDGKSKVIVHNKNVSFREKLSQDNFSLFKYKNSHSTDYSTYSTIEPLRIACERFIACIQNGDTPESNARNGLNVVNFIEDVHRALSANKEYHIN